ncbi:enolase C-terminal domain-like protein [Streptomyces sp. NPDC050617]|uniref:enolase C-terminal domain-like protein n=1 Tax=Streptomyces sp. NPDC050617 TaxID=3154628 RepID=UPI003422D955
MLEILRVHIARVPMERPFAHTAHARARTESVLLSLRWQGFEGWGEGAPRPYVTDETAESAVAALQALDTALLEPLLAADGFSGAVAALASLDLPRLLGGLHRAPAAAAALETALLDAVCRRHRRPLADVLDACPWAADALAAPGGAPPVSQVVDLSRTPEELLGAMPDAVRARLTHVKLKALPSPEETAERARSARALLGPGVRLSVDANCGWEPEHAEAGARLLREAAAVDWIEEPTTPRQWTVLHRIQQAGMPVMLDESAVDPADVTWAAAAGAAALVNIRVSKCGGLLPALRTAVRARECGMRVQLGVQVGEIGPLWSAGRTLAARLADLAAVECGRQDEWFPEPLTVPPYRADRERHAAPPPPGMGHGLRPSPALAPHLTVRSAPGADIGRPARQPASSETNASETHEGDLWTSHGS